MVRLHTPAPFDEVSVDHPTTIDPDGYHSSVPELGDEGTSYTSISSLFRSLTGPGFEELRRIPVRNAAQLHMLTSILGSQKGRDYVRSMGTIKIVADTPELKAKVRDLLAYVQTVEGRDRKSVV